MNHEDLIARARRGDADAFRLIFERYTRPVISFIFYMVNERELAEELAQETFVRAYRGLDTFRGKVKLSTWLFGIARNVAREALRSRQRDRARGSDLAIGDIDVREARPSPAGELLEKEFHSQVRRALMSLPDDQRAVFALRVYQQRSYDEIAELTGFSIPKVRNDLHRARAEMRKRLNGYLGVAK